MREEKSSNEEESRKVCEVIMEEIYNEILGLDGALEENGGETTNTNTNSMNTDVNHVQNNSNNVQNGAKNDFFQTLSF